MKLDSKKYRNENIEVYRKRSNEYDRTHKERRKEINEKYRNEKAEEKKKYQSDWLKNNVEKVKEYFSNRKIHDITKNEWIACKEYFEYKCAYCGLPINEHEKPYRGKLVSCDFHKEHVDDNGSNGLDNCVPACHSCNSKKWKFDFDEWYNKENPIYSIDRYNKIIQWLEEDYRKCQ